MADAPAYPRATRAAGKQTRRALLDAAGRLFSERGLAGVSAGEIARAAGVFPSQVTYYFGSKDALFVEAACRGVLHAAADVERAGSRARSPRGYVRGIVRTALASPALQTFMEAALLARSRPELAPLVRDTFARLHAEGERALVESLTARGWSIRAKPAHEARGFWAAIFGVVLERAAVGETFDQASADATVELVLNLYTEPDRPAKGGASHARPSAA
jgi:AcrR family transcriptional regulator